GGSNLQALMDKLHVDPGSPVNIAVVVSDRERAGALDRARAGEIPTAVVRPADHATREGFDDAIGAHLADHDVELVVLAGFLRILQAPFVAQYAGRIINTHNALLPSFPGMYAVRDALAYGAKVTGATVHYVDETVDGGRIIAQRAVPVLPDDSVEALSARVQQAEHTLLPIAVDTIARDILDGRAESDRP
ncbi:phosphoribosylglycinamide formyltransferase, partial [Candidatus Poribacteria bacterium]|nr:phosphoribosylglycinamide formyltransferase [Candidatus Poribacteria bacterium]